MIKRISILASLLTMLTLAVMAMSTDSFHSRHHNTGTANVGTTQDDALTAIARSKVPAAAVVTKYKTDHKDGETEIRFYDAATAMTYEVTLYTNTKKIHEVEIKSKLSADSTVVEKSETDIKQRILAAYPDAQNIVIHLDRDDHTYHYDAHFTTPNAIVKAKLHPTTGAFAKQEVTYL